jgi:plasmid stabilization system protein ParE
VFIARDSEQAADAVRSRILNATEPLREFPLLGRVLPEGDSERTREVIVGSYRVIYELVSDGGIEVFAVIHGARSLDLS